MTRSTLRAAVATVLAVGLVLAVPPNLAAQTRDGFIHAKHVKLFPVCAGCHAGVLSGDATSTFPTSASCATCHDGTIQPRTTWTPISGRGTGLLAYSHPAHQAKAPDVTCASCHGVDGSTQWMNVAKAAPQNCLSCHTHTASTHFADGNACATCHRPLAAATALTDADIIALPRPPSHSEPRFVSTHGLAASALSATCATCHARQSCARCHVNASQSAVIQALAPDARVARTVAALAPSYPAPADHGSVDFPLTHGVAARSALATCATCHARPSCETCHQGGGARDALNKLPTARAASARGVRLRRAPQVPPSSVTAATVILTPRPHESPDTTRHQVRMHPADFSQAHGRIASSGELQCAGCHAQKTCNDCHTGERVGRRYHPANFVASHAPEAYGRETSCSSCHNTAAFCRDCHSQIGLAARSNTARSPLFHNARPLWLIDHGRAARQDLTTCATCHQQTYCMQCHSQLGSRINPHGPAFDAKRMSGKNSRICLACHFKNPLAP